MGTLIKEDFGRPDRANTMAKSLLLILVHVLTADILEIPLNSLFNRACDMALMINLMMMVLHLQYV